MDMPGDKKLESIAENIPVGIYEAVGTAIIYANPYLAKLADRGIKEIVDHDWSKHVCPDDRQGYLHQWADVADTGHEIYQEYRLELPDGEQRWVSDHAIALKNEHGGFRGYLGVISDITSRKEAQSKLRSTVSDLARSNRNLSDFASAVSHDLQEPLRKIVAFDSMLARMFPQSENPKANELVSYLGDSAERMQQLITDLLAFSEVGAGISVSQVNLDEALNHALDALAVPISETRAVVTRDPLPTVNGDSVQLQQLMQNLIGNALKYRDGHTPQIQVHAQDTASDWIVSVTDNGIGIEAKDQQRVFEIFQRLHPRHEYPGTGIGLALCQKIVELHGGKIWVESTFGQGSTFSFSLPKGPIS